MKCIDYIKEKDGKLFIANCGINEDSKSVNEKLRFERQIAQDDSYLLPRADCKYVNCSKRIDEKRISGASIYIRHSFMRSIMVRDMRLHIDGIMEVYPFHTIADFEEFADSLKRSNHFKLTTPPGVNSSSINYISLESEYCELEIEWPKKDAPYNFYINVMVTPSHNAYNETYYDREILLCKNARRMTLELGKEINKFTDKELTDLYHKSGFIKSSKNKQIKLSDLPGGMSSLFLLYWQTEEASPEVHKLPMDEQIRTFLKWCIEENWDPLGEADKKKLIENGYFPYPRLWPR